MIANDASRGVGIDIDMGEPGVTGLHDDDGSVAAGEQTAGLGDEDIVVAESGVRQLRVERCGRPVGAATLTAWSAADEYVVAVTGNGVPCRRAEPGLSAGDVAGLAGDDLRQCGQVDDSLNPRTLRMREAIATVGLAVPDRSQWPATRRSQERSGAWARLTPTSSTRPMSSASIWSSSLARLGLPCWRNARDALLWSARS